jgi:hypothetical protein
MPPITTTTTMTPRVQPYNTSMQSKKFVRFSRLGPQVIEPTSSIFTKKSHFPTSLFGFKNSVPFSPSKATTSKGQKFLLERQLNEAKPLKSILRNRFYPQQGATINLRY